MVRWGIDGCSINFTLHIGVPMKTQDDLLEHYWSVIVPMARKHGIKPYECVRYCGDEILRKNHPKFNEPEEYTFAIAILEGKPVFTGDKVWLKGHTVDHWITVEEDLYINPNIMTWTPPTKKRTFVLELTEQELVILGEIPVEQRFFDYPETMTLISKIRTLLDDRSKQNAM